MEVIVKNNQISKTHISKMAYNHINNILACNIDGNDTILFFSLDSESMTFIELFKGMSKPPGSKISMTWSPDGKYLALAAGNVQMWEFKDGRIKPVKSFQEDFIEIKIIEWSVDSQCYACGGISRTNTIKIRNIETGKVRQLQLPQRQTISAISFDPYGKYLFLLLRNNSIEIYSVVNYQKYKSVRLSPQGLKINPIKQIRLPSWSPDFSNFVCPSLDDSRINLAVNLSRTKDFRTKNIFMGHCTSISCCKFNPKLYKWNGQITSIVAMGDSAGNVSFWRVGSKNDYPQPLLLSNSLQNSMEVVEDLDWDEKGEILMVNMMKRYVHLIKFVDKNKTFGIQLSNDEMFSLIRQTYGSNRATDVNKRQIEVFDFNASAWGQIQQEKKVNDLLEDAQQNPSALTLQNQNNGKVQVNQKIVDENLVELQQDAMQIEEQIIKQKIVEQKPKIHLFIPQTAPIQSFPVNSMILTPPMIGQSKNEYVKMSQQKVMIGKNNKKKIQPAMMVRKDQIGSMGLKQPLMNQFQMGGANNSMNTMFFSNSMVQTFPSLQLPLISFSQKQITISKNRILQIKKLNKVTSLQIIDLLQDQQYLSRRIFPSTIDFVHVSEKFIYVINQQFLYIFDLELNPKQLPLKVGQIHKFLANQNGVVYFISCEGYLIGFDHVKNINKTLTPVPLHLLINQNFQSQNNPVGTSMSIKQFLLTINSDIFITIESEKSNLKNKRQRFLYDLKKNGWSKLEFKEGLLQPGFSIRITDSEQNVIKSFFSSLCPSLKQKTYQQAGNLQKPRTNVSSGVVSHLEQEMIFYQKYHKDTDKFYDCLIQYLNSLKNERRNREFRNLVNQYFFDTKNLNYITTNEERHKLWQRVTKSVGGNIIQEFMINVENKSVIDIE